MTSENNPSAPYYLEELGEPWNIPSVFQRWEVKSSCRHLGCRSLLVDKTQMKSIVQVQVWLLLRVELSFRDLPSILRVLYVCLACAYLLAPLGAKCPQNAPLASYSHQSHWQTGLQFFETTGWELCPPRPQEWINIGRTATCLPQYPSSFYPCW